MRAVQREVQKAVARLTKPKAWPATIVGAGSRTGFTRVRFSNGLETDVLNIKMSSVADLKVRVGYDPLMPGELQVLGMRERISLSGTASRYLYWLVDHHRNHEFPGHDTVWVHGAQFIPLNVAAMGGYTVSIYGSVLRGSGEWFAFTSETHDFSGSIPTTGARFILIEVDTSGQCVFTGGVEKNSRHNLEMSDIPAPTKERISIAAVMTYAGQDEIRQDTRPGRRNDIIDLRWSNWNRIKGSSAIASDVHEAPSKTTPVNLDEIPLVDSEDDWSLVKLTMANLKNYLYDYFLGLFAETERGLPVGGLTGQVLGKSSDDDYNVLWQDIDSGVSGDLIWGVEGALSVEDDVPHAHIVTKPTTIETVYIYCKDTGSAGTTKVDILCNGVSILDASMLTLAYNDGNKWASAVPVTTDFDEGDIFTLNIETVATGASDMTVALEVGGGGLSRHFNLTVKEADGSPSVSNVETIEVEGATVTDEGGGTAKILVPSQVQYLVLQDHTHEQGITATSLTNTSSSFVYQEQPFFVSRPLLLTGVRWWIRKAGTYTMLIVDEDNDSEYSVSASASVSDGDFPTFDVGEFLLRPGHWRARLTITSAVNVQWHHLANNDGLYFSAWNTTRNMLYKPLGSDASDYAYTAPIKLIFYDSDFHYE